MMNKERSHSEYFEELCALAAIGQIAELEYVELRDHMQGCAQCRSSYGEFIDLIHNKLPLADPDLTGSLRRIGLFSQNSSYRERFLTRARKQGLAVSGGTARDIPASKSERRLFPRLDFAHAAAAAIVLLVLTAGCLGYALHLSRARDIALVSALAAMKYQAQQQVKLESREEQDARLAPSASSIETFVLGSETLPSSTKSDAELEIMRQKYAKAEAKVKELQQKLQSITLVPQSPGAQLQESNDAKQSTAHVNEQGIANESRPKDASTQPAPLATQQSRLEPKPESRRAAVSNSVNQCLQIDYRITLTRLKTKVDPEIPLEARPYIQTSSVTVRVKIRIDALGNVINSETQGGSPMFNNAVKTAMDRWKFSPAMDASGARCVDTEIPLVIGPLTTR